jgi:hypothetical protein
VAGTPAQPQATAAWTPPADPDPHVILREAKADTQAGRFEEALAKHVWFHRHALDIEEALYGVRLSFALSYWMDLAEVYPPAKAKLIEIRDETEKQVTTSKEPRDSFHDFESINSALGDENRTIALFTSLDKDNSDLAKEVFDLACPDLINAGKIKQFSKYVDPKDYSRQVEAFRTVVDSDEPEFAKAHTDFAQKAFVNEVSTMVALLVLSDRKSEAERIAADAETVFDDKAFAGELEKALDGTVPEPWPPKN